MSQIEAKFLDGKVIDEYGDEWEVFTDDACGHYAVQRDAGEHYEAGQFAPAHGCIYRSDEGSTFGVNSQDEYIVEGGKWADSESVEA
jgi:hypothetical protein